MSFPQNNSLHYEKSVFTQLFSLMSREIYDPQSKQMVFFFKSNIKNLFSIYRDKSKQDLLLECEFQVERGKIKFEWEVFDVMAGRKPIGRMKKELMKTFKQFGAEAWTITDPSGQPLLIFERGDGDSKGKRVLDGLTGLYNPTHQYNIWNAKKEPVARIFAKMGLWKTFHDLVFEERATELERKMTVALFAALTLMLKK